MRKNKPPKKCKKNNKFAKTLEKLKAIKKKKQQTKKQNRKKHMKFEVFVQGKLELYPVI